MAKQKEKQNLAINPDVWSQDENTCDAVIAGLKNAEYSCDYCKHIHSDGISCDAFPDLIPTEIFEGDFRHTKPYEGDNGIRFEARE